MELQYESRIADTPGSRSAPEAPRAFLEAGHHRTTPLSPLIPPEIFRAAAGTDWLGDWLGRVPRGESSHAVTAYDHDVVASGIAIWSPFCPICQSVRSAHPKLIPAHRHPGYPLSTRGTVLKPPSSPRVPAFKNGSLSNQPLPVFHETHDA